MERLIVDEFEVLREKLLFYLDQDNYNRDRFTALYEVAGYLSSIMSKMKHPSLKYIAKGIRVTGISDKFLEDLLSVLRTTTYDKFLDNALHYKVDTLEGYINATRYAAKVNETFKHSPAEVAIDVIKKLSVGMKDMKTFDWSYQEIKKIVSFLASDMPVLARSSLIHDEYFFAFQPCCGCGKELNLVEDPDGFTVIDFGEGDAAFQVPMCSTCNHGSMPDPERALELYVKYSKKLEKEIMRDIDAYSHDAIVAEVGDDVIQFGDFE